MSEDSTFEYELLNTIREYLKVINNCFKKYINVNGNDNGDIPNTNKK
jgi:hypothetical protein